MIFLLIAIETCELTSNPIFAHFNAYKGGLLKYELETIIIFRVKSFVPLIYGFGINQIQYIIRNSVFTDFDPYLGL